MCAVVVGMAVVTTAALWIGRSDRPAPRSHEPVAIERPIVKRSLEERGKELYEKKGCVVCHSIDGSARVGPTFLHDYGSTITLADGITVRVDEAYIRESLLRPQAHARPGYPPSMPTYEGLLKEREINALIAFLKSLR